jgi:hypothetical protein
MILNCSKKVIRTLHVTNEELGTAIPIFLRVEVFFTRNFFSRYHCM